MPYPESLDPHGLLRGRVNDLKSRVDFALSGELDLASADGLLERLTRLSQQTPGDVHVDLTDLEFLGSTGIRALLVVHADLSKDGHRLVLRNPGRRPRPGHGTGRAERRVRGRVAPAPAGDPPQA